MSAPTTVEVQMLGGYPLRVDTTCTMRVVSLAADHVVVADDQDALTFCLTGPPCPEHLDCWHRYAWRLSPASVAACVAAARALARPRDTARLVRCCDCDDTCPELDALALGWRALTRVGDEVPWRCPTCDGGEAA